MAISGTGSHGIHDVRGAHAVPKVKEAAILEDHIAQVRLEVVYDETAILDYHTWEFSFAFLTTI